MTDAERALQELRRHVDDVLELGVDHRCISRAEDLLRLLLDAGYGEPLRVMATSGRGVRLEWPHLVVDTRPVDNGDDDLLTLRIGS